MRPDDVCPRSSELLPMPTRPHAPAIFPTSVWECSDPDQAGRMLGGQLPGYVYQRDGHPNADQLVSKCCELHRAEQAVVTSSGMAALSAAVLALLQAGDHVAISSHLYGKSQLLLGSECSRLGITSSLVDTCDLSAVASAMTPRTRMIVVETIANPLLQVADIAALAEIAHRNRSLLLVDNTFATPILCRPLVCGADLVLESITKMMNGHSDVMLGLLAGHDRNWAASARRFGLGAGEVLRSSVGWRAAVWRHWRCGWSGPSRRRSASRSIWWGGRTSSGSTTRA